MEQIARILLFVITVLIFTSDLVHSKTRQKRIIGGSDAKSSEFIYQLSLQNSKTNKHFCAGVIINDDFVLTSAQCVSDLQPNDLTIFYGSRRLSDTGYRTNVKAIFIHPNFTPKTKKQDAALLATTSKIQFIKNVSGPVTLPQLDNFVNRTLIVSGWGTKDVNKNLFYFLCLFFFLFLFVTEFIANSIVDAAKHHFRCASVPANVNDSNTTLP